MKKILIYQDKGTSSFSVQSLLLSLQQENLDKKYILGRINSDHLQTDLWQVDTHLLIFPGGRDLPYCHSLQGLANRNIINFVQRGGSFLGICAGAYYASGLVNFEMGNLLEVVGTRELQFFPGIAYGPAYGLGTFSYENSSGARIAGLDIRLPHKISEPAAAYFNGGCLFLQVEKYKAYVSTISTYVDIAGYPPAIIECQVGKGRAILSGVHPEYSAYHMGSDQYFDKNHITLLENIENKRRSLFQTLLQRFEIN